MTSWLRLSRFPPERDVLTTVEALLAEPAEVAVLLPKDELEATVEERFEERRVELSEELIAEEEELHVRRPSQPTANGTVSRGRNAPCG